MGANIALIFSGQFVRYVSALRRSAVGPGDPWAQSLRLLMGGVVASGAAILAIFRYMQTQVMTDPECVDLNAQKKAKTKTTMGLKESATFLAKSPYIRNVRAAHRERSLPSPEASCAPRAARSSRRSSSATACRSTSSRSRGKPS